MGLYKKQQKPPIVQEPQPEQQPDPPKPSKKRKANRKDVQFLQMVNVPEPVYPKPVTLEERLFDQMFPGRLKRN